VIWKLVNNSLSVMDREIDSNRWTVEISVVILLSSPAIQCLSIFMVSGFGPDSSSFSLLALLSLFRPDRVRLWDLPPRRSLQPSLKIWHDGESGIAGRALLKPDRNTTKGN
jgi:hypothetical protein